MARAQEVWRVRVCGSDGAVYGAGVLVAGCSVLTCAHVVEHALGMDAPLATLLTPPEALRRWHERRCG
jgi:hypothetical protein